MERKQRMERDRIGLLLGVERADASIEAEKDEPGVKYPGLRIVACIPGLPTKELPSQWLPASPAWGMQLPAYSGGTAWDLHPLRATAGQNR
jgi:hypothetical protein